MNNVNLDIYENESYKKNFQQRKLRNKYIIKQYFFLKKHVGTKHLEIKYYHNILYFFYMYSHFNFGLSLVDKLSVEHCGKIFYQSILVIFIFIISVIITIPVVIISTFVVDIVVMQLYCICTIYCGYMFEFGQFGVVK